MIYIKARATDINKFTGDLVWGSRETVRLKNFNYQIIIRVENGKTKFAQHADGRKTSFR